MENMRKTQKIRERELERDKGKNKSKQIWQEEERLVEHKIAQREEKSGKTEKQREPEVREGSKK